ncbi:uncharacterized protein LOC143056293 [Mytilus galloprovincialis]|uniref:uncharacterized protein LOC143056293 n=1 Tax=Mytilus galloprovincialis TaxID=29158 RepID=UPI003F7BB121
MSYVSQGLSPLESIGVMDTLEEGSAVDVQLQDSTNTYRARWDVSGDPCPAVNYKWKVQRLDGLVVADWKDMDLLTEGMVDGLSLLNGELYYSLVKVTTAIGYSYFLRSDGVTIQQNALLPGRVFDGDMTGYDLNVLSSQSIVFANWDGFGLPSNTIAQVDILTGKAGIQIDQADLEAQPLDQKIVKYEVALGTDRRFAKTRDDTVPFTDVGLNKSVIFFDLHLTPGAGRYYFSVRAYSSSYSMVEVSSNGFYVGFDGGVTAGTINMESILSVGTYVDVQFSGFESKIEILMYYVAMSNNTDAMGTSCTHYVDGGDTTNEEKMKMFTEYNLTNIKTDTYIKMENLNLTAGQKYYVFVMGVDRSGECNMTYHEFTIDNSPPLVGRMKTGPYFDMPISYTSDSSSLYIYWENYTDPESDIKSYQVSLWRNSSCNVGSTQNVEVDWISLDSNFTDYTFVDLDLQNDMPYKVKLRVTNKAGHFIQDQSNSVFYDGSQPTAGRVVTGLDYRNDQVWFSSSLHVSGIFLHMASPTVVTCPSNPVSLVSGTNWKTVVQTGMEDPSGEKWNLEYRDQNVGNHITEDEIWIKLARDVKKEQLFTGGYYRPADFNGGGEYQISIQAASGEGYAVTEVMLWEGPVDGIATYNHYRESDWTQEVCSCCFITPIPENCTACNCTKYLSDKFGNENVTAPPTMSTTTMVMTTTQPYEIVQTVKTDEEDVVYNITNTVNTTVTEQEPVDTSTSPARPSCGIQIVAGTSPYLVSWCRLYNDSLTPLYTDDDLDFDPSAGFHDYKMVVDYEKYDQIENTWCLKVYVDGSMFSKICGIPEFSSDTKLLLHVFNKNNYVPPVTDLFDVFSTRASFRNVIMPPSSDAMCRYGGPFYGGVIPIDRYEAGIGTDQLMTDVVSYQEVLDPCIPCYSPCAPYTCQTTCNPTEQKLLNFTLTGLSLPAKREENTTGQLVNTSISYFLTVKAVLSSGKSAEASSSVFYIDDTLPWFDLDQMTPMYIDIKQGELTPVSFQSSNSTIKAFWRCIDEESQIVENWWSIGTSVGSEDLQPWTSVGEDQIASNNSFGGVLQNNKTYYVSVRCKNGAGLEATHTDVTGVRVLLEPPSANGVIVTIPDSSDFDGIDIYPNGSRTTLFDSSMGMTFTVGTDQSIYRYDWCLGSDELRDDIFPCTWIGHNASGTIKIQNGWLTINTADVRRLSELNPAQDSSLSETERLSDDNNVFKMEPGRTIFMMLQVCNEAVLCTPLQIASVLVINDKSVVCHPSSTSSPCDSDGHDIQIDIDPAIHSRRKKRHLDNGEIKVETPDLIFIGQSLLLQPMDNATLTENYLSSASDSFLPYIVNPYNTTDKLERLLHGRWVQSQFLFGLASIGHVPYPGPITLEYDNTEHDKDNGMKIIITHWNPRNQQWEITSRSCLGVDGVTDLEVNGTHADHHSIKIKVCNTWSSSDGQISDFFVYETLFSKTLVLIDLVNTPPELEGPTNITFSEDEGTLQYPLKAIDQEGDQVLFYLNSSETYDMGTPTLTVEGLLLYTPCEDCTGLEIIPVILLENQTGTDISPLSTTVYLWINVTDLFDPPVIFLTQYGETLLGADPTEPIIVYLEEKTEVNEDNWSPVWIAVLGAYDVEIEDNLILITQNSSFGILNMTEESNTAPNITTCPPIGDREQTIFPCGNLGLNKEPEKAAWLYMELFYNQFYNESGIDEIKIYIQDENNMTSDVITVQFVILMSPCYSHGDCQPKTGSPYPCQDVQRATNFTQYYYCLCEPGWEGEFCEINIDECATNPCDSPYVCTDGINSYTCACHVSDPDCDALPPWVFALIAIGALILILIILGLLYRWKVKKSGHFKWVLKYILCHEEPQKYDYKAEDDTRSISTVTSIMSQEFINLKYDQNLSDYEDSERDFEGMFSPPPPYRPMNDMERMNFVKDIRVELDTDPFSNRMEWEQCFPPKSEWVTYQRHQRSDFNPLITTHTENSKFTTPTPVPDEESIPQKEGGEYVLLERHKKSSFNALMAKSIEDIAEGRTTPPTQMSLMKNDKSPLQNGDVVVPTVKIAPAPETIVEVLPQTDGPRFNLPKILKLPEPTPIHMTWRAQTEVHEDRPSTSGLSSSSGGHEDSDAMPSSSGEHFDKIPPRPMSRNVARWAPSAVTHKSQASKQAQEDSTDDDEFGFDLETRSERPKSRYRIREAKPDENKYKGSYSNYPDSHAPML